MRPVLFAVIGLILFGAGLATGRLTVSSDAGFQPGSLPGDDALEQAWENLLQSQRAALLLLRDSEFYGDDQERAEAYYALLHDIEAAIPSGPGESGGDRLLGRLPAPQPHKLPLTPNGMASMLEDAADRIYQRSGQRLALARQAFESARNGITVFEPQGNMQVGLGHWNLNNDQALLIEFPQGSADDVALSMGNVWAMGLNSTATDAGARLACAGAAGCRGILSHRDPELGGWLDTGGHRRGLLLLRWRSGEQAPVAKLVRFDALGNSAAAREPDAALRQEEGTP